MEDNWQKLTEKEEFEIAEKILEKYSVLNILHSVDEQMLDYVDDDWEEDGFDSEYEWYCEYGRGEAEDDVINELVREYEKDYSIEFDVDSFIAIGKYIAEKAGINY